MTPGSAEREADRVDGVEGAGLGVRAEVDAREPLALADELADRVEDLADHALQRRAACGARPCRSRRCS